MTVVKYILQLKISNLIFYGIFTPYLNLLSLTPFVRDLAQALGAFDIR